MYYGRKACPVGNRLLHDAEVRRRQTLHRERLSAMSAHVDTRPPAHAELPHMQHNPKKEQMMEERFARIERENRLLLGKMSEIMSRPSALRSSIASSPPPAARSLHSHARTRELRRITEENMRILGRIQAVQPAYDRWKWEEERVAQERLVESISEYKRDGRRARTHTHTHTSTSPGGRDGGRDAAPEFLGRAHASQRPLLAAGASVVQPTAAPAPSSVSTHVHTDATRDKAPTPTPTPARTSGASASAATAAVKADAEVAEQPASSPAPGPAAEEEYGADKFEEA